MPTLQNGSGALRINVPRGSSLIIRNQSGVETVTGSSVAREDATFALGANAFVYGPQTASSDVSISTTGVLTYDIVAGDPTPASVPAAVSRSAATGAAIAAVDPATGQPLGGGGVIGVGLVAGRSRPASVLRNDAPYQSGMGQMRQIAKDDITEIMVATATWYLQNGLAETAFGGSVQYTCGIHDLSGNKTQITWTGAPIITQADNTTAFSDWVTLVAPIKRGQTFYVKTWGKSVSGAAMGFSTGRDANGSTWLDRCYVGSAGSPTADLTMTSGLSSAGGNGFSWMVEPCMIYGKTARGAVVLIGTSITASQGDAATDGYALTGRTERQVARYWGTSNLGCGGTQAQTSVSSSNWTRRKELIDKLTVPVAIVSEFGTNDVASRTSAQILADLNTIRGILGREFFIQADLLPRTDGSNVVAAGFATVRPAFNSALPTLPTGIDGYFADSPLVESTTTANTWANPPGSGAPDTGDGIHPGSNAGIKFQNAENAAKAVRTVLGD